MVKKATTRRTLGALLLSDFRDIFDEEGGQEDDKTQIPTSYLVVKLLEREDRPWKTLYRGQPIKEQGVARLLRPYRITPKRLKLDMEERDYFRLRLPSFSILSIRPQGYRVGQFTHAWNRYLQARQGRQSKETVGVAGDADPRQKPGHLSGRRTKAEFKSRADKPTKAAKTSGLKTARKALGNGQKSGVSGPNPP